MHIKHCKYPDKLRAGSQFYGLKKPPTHLLWIKLLILPLLQNNKPIMSLGTVRINIPQYISSEDPQYIVACILDNLSSAVFSLNLLGLTNKSSDRVSTRFYKP